MKLSYDRDRNIAYLRLRPKAGRVESIPVSGELNVDIAPDGSVSHKLSTKRFGPFVLPEREGAERYFTPWSSAATADFVAMMAQAARHFRGTVG